MLFTKILHFIALFFAILYSGVATSQTSIFNFQVEREVMRMKQSNGWDNWAQSQQSLFRLSVVTANNQKFYTLIQGYDSETVQTKDELEVK
jgi:hypothetical protein